MDEHVRNMTEIVLLYDSVSQNSKVRHEAKGKLAAKKQKGQQIREAAMRGQVRKRDLLERGSVARCQVDVGAQDDSPAKKSRTPKNQFEKEVDTVVNGLNQKTEEFREALKQKSERDRENSEQQKELNTKINMLIDTT